MNEQLQRYSRYDTEAESRDYIAALGPRGISVFLLRIIPISRVSLCDFLFFKKELRIFYLNNRHLSIIHAPHRATSEGWESVLCCVPAPEVRPGAWELLHACYWNEQCERTQGSAQGKTGKRAVFSATVL